MLELLGWNVGMSLVAALGLVIAALAIGVIAQFIGDVRVGYEWVATSAAAVIGGYLGSEALGQMSTVGPAFEGLYIVPAFIGALIVGAAVDAVFRYTTHGSYTHEARPV